jgi:hypothetical protein
MSQNSNASYIKHVSWKCGTCNRKQTEIKENREKNVSVLWTSKKNGGIYVVCVLRKHQIYETTGNS